MLPSFNTSQNNIEDELDMILSQKFTRDSVESVESELDAVLSQPFPNFNESYCEDLSQQFLEKASFNKITPSKTRKSSKSDNPSKKLKIDKTDNRQASHKISQSTPKKSGKSHKSRNQTKNPITSGTTTDSTRASQEISIHQPQQVFNFNFGATPAADIAVILAQLVKK